MEYLSSSDAFPVGTINDMDIRDRQLSPFKAGAFITISREYGCSAMGIAKMLVDNINKQKGQQKPWSWVSKEILEKSTDELQTDYKKIGHIFDGKKRKIHEASKLYIKSYDVSDNNIVKAVKDIIQNLAFDGNVVIVGRGGAMVTRHFPKGVHVKLHAPIDFRVNRIAENLRVSTDKAFTKLMDIDEKRSSFLSFFLDGKSENDYYDLMINRADFDDDEIVDLILDTAKLKGVIK
jgi:cytidylate kinase